MKIQFLFYRVVAGAVLMLPLVSDADAAIISAASSGHGLSVDLNALSVLDVDVGPLPAGVAGTGSIPYAASDTEIDLNSVSSVPLVVSGTVSASVIDATASSDVDGLPGSRTTSASGAVVDAGIDLTGLAGGLTLLGIDGTLSSTAEVSGDFGSLSATGSTTIQSLDVVISGITVDLSAFVGVSVPPNTGIDLSVLGIADTTLILNEQVVAPDDSSISVNALRLSTNLLDIGGDVVIGHSQASVTAVPEPPVGTLIAIVFVPIAIVRARSMSLV